MLLAKNVTLSLHFLPFMWPVEGGHRNRENAVQEKKLPFEESPKKHEHGVWL